MRSMPMTGSAMIATKTLSYSQTARSPMDYLNSFLLLAGVHLLAVASPGPDFAVVLKHSIQYGRRAALWTSTGVGLGILVHVGYCLMGLGLVISQSILMFTVLKYLAAAYLLWIGIQALRSRPQAAGETRLEPAAQLRDLRALKIGFITNVLNPKATLFFLSLFTLVVAPGTPLGVQTFFGLYMALATLLWFAALSLLFSQARVRRWFLRLGHWFDRAIGGVLVALSARVALD